ncbi:MAG: LPD38 domain-containing protein, partial [Candidatus Dormibacteria bacterium]
PKGVSNRASSDLEASLGREPSPLEIVAYGNKLLDTITTSGGIDPTIPKGVLNEAVGNLLEVKKNRELPTTGEINKTAKKLMRQSAEENVLAKKDEAGVKKENVLAKKDEAGVKEETLANKIDEEGELEARGFATPEERARLQPIEDLISRFKNAHDLITVLAKYAKDGHIAKLFNRILSNPYLKEKLKGDKITVVNPEDIVSGKIKSSVGWNKKGITLGQYNSSSGIHLAGAGFKSLTGIDNGLHITTIAHEVLHAALLHVIEGVRRGYINDPDILKAYHELREIQKTLRENVDKIEGPKYYKKLLKYGLDRNPDLDDLHEFISVTMSDGRIQGLLKNIKMGALSAWNKLMFVYNRLLKGSPDNLSVMDRVATLTDTLLSYKPKEFTEKIGTLPTVFSKVKDNTADRVREAISITPQKLGATKVPSENSETKAQQFAAYYADKLKPLLFDKQKLIKKGAEVLSSEDLDIGARVYQNLGARDSSIANERYVNPALLKIVELAKKLKQEPGELLAHLSAFYMGKRALEVNERGELEKASLSAEAEIKRSSIIKAWSRGELPEGRYIEELRKLINEPGARKSSKIISPMSGITNSVAYELIATAKKNGINDNTVNQFEPYRRAMVNVISENYEKSKRYSRYDAARRSGLGSKWYLPLKGFGESQDIEPSTIGAFTREYKAVKGRSSISANPLINLMQEVIRSARDIPENNLTKIVYNYAKKFGVEIHTLNAEQAAQDAIASGKGLSSMDVLYKNENTIVHNAGNYRFSIEFPKNDPRLKALKSINETPELNAALKIFGIVTNLVARGATTLRPAFLFWNAIWRDMGYVGSVIALDEGPAATAEYVARYWLQGGPLRGRFTYFKSTGEGFIPRTALERDIYAQQSRSKFAKSLAEIAKYGGDLSFQHGLNLVTNLNDIFAQLQKASKTNVVKQLPFLAVKYLDQIGTSDIMTARVAAYETYISRAIRKLGKNATKEQIIQAKKDGAIFSRRLLDYQQKAELSEGINALFPFSRVAINQADRLTQSFKNTDGSLNYKKMAITAGFGLMAGALYYSLLRQANPDIKKQENATLATNFLITDGKTIYKIPMAYGITRLVLVPGMLLAKLYYNDGNESKEDVANEIRNIVVEALTPLKLPEPKHNERLSDEAQDFFTAMMPSAIRPEVELAENRGYFGQKITREDKTVKGPHSQAGKATTPNQWKWLAENLRKVTDGAID